MKYFYININDDETLGLQAISLVDKPAIEQDFLLFKDEHICFAKDNSKHIISGPALIAEMPIYRRNQVGEEYYVVFDKNTIAKLVERYSKNGFFNIVNLQHDHSLFTENAILVESYFVDKERGISPKEYGNLTDGSWIVSFKIEDENLWNDIVNGKDLNGFSVEVAANLIEKLESEKSEEQPKTLEEALDELIDEMLENK